MALQLTCGSALAARVKLVNALYWDFGFKYPFLLSLDDELSRE